MKHPLAKPITAHNEELNELELRDPGAKDVMDLGYPYLAIQSGDEAGIELRPKVAARYISRLAQIPMSSVEQLAIADLQALQAWLMDFFGDGSA